MAHCDQICCSGVAFHQETVAARDRIDSRYRAGSDADNFPDTRASAEEPVVLSVPLVADVLVVDLFREQERPNRGHHPGLQLCGRPLPTHRRRER